MTEEEKEYIKKLMENEASEWAMRECVGEYRKTFMPMAMALRGCYESMINVGFDVNQSTLLTMNYLTMINKEKK